MSNLSPSVLSTVNVTTAATQLGLSNAGNVPLILGTNGGSFGGAVVPVIQLPYQQNSVSQMFVVLAWSTIENQTVTYVVKKNDVSIYEGPLNMIIDVVDVNATNSATYSVYAKSTSSCTSQPQYTTCPPLEYQGAMCTSIPTGSISVINFLIPDPSGAGCIAISTGDETDAAYYYCAYLQNTDKTVEGIKVPSPLDYSQCMSITPVTNGVVVADLNEIIGADGNPGGYCTDASCTQGFSNFTRSAVCGCGADGELCRAQQDLGPNAMGLPFVSVVGETENGYMSAKDFSTGMNGLASFLKLNPKLLF
jgi:hypothetical protein